MKPLHTTLGAVILLASVAVTAQQRFGGDNNTNQSVDTQNFCVYAGQEYSIGALIQVGDQMLECRMVPSTSELVESGARWTTLYSDAGAQ